jgi:hypothetical protein
MNTSLRKSTGFFTLRSTPAILKSPKWAILPEKLPIFDFG